MLGALEGFGVISVIVFAGWLLGRSGVLGDEGQRVMASIVFYAGTPALLYVTISRTQLDHIFNASLLATAGSSVLVGVAIFVWAKWIRRSITGDAVMNAWSVSYVNIGNLGIPIATYVLGTLSYVAPVLLFQLLILAPVGMAILDASTSRRAGHSAAPWWRAPLLVIRNPIIIGACLGLISSGTGFQLPHVIHDPIAMIGNTSVPLTLMAFGVSLRNGWATPKSGTRTTLTVMSVTKLLLQPTIAWAIGGPLLGYTGTDLLAIVVTSALPTAQNVYVYALRYRQAETLTRDVVFITTILSIPTIILSAVIFG